MVETFSNNKTDNGLQRSIQILDSKKTFFSDFERKNRSEPKKLKILFPTKKVSKLDVFGEKKTKKKKKLLIKLNQNFLLIKIPGETKRPESDETPPT